MKKINYLNPFGRMCVSMGMIPSTYKESLTYEEQLLWLLNYLEKTVIPAVNGNAEATEELQKYYEELKQYVDDYFTDLNVQEQINNKLDEMALSGELEEIIAIYLNSQSVICYDTVADLKDSTSLQDGSYARTLGYYSVNDGGASLYKISDDDLTADDGFIIELDNGLYASLIVKDTVIAEQVGCNGNGSFDNKAKLTSILDKGYSIKLSKNKTYNVSGSIIMNQNTTLDLNDSILNSTTNHIITNFRNNSTATGYNGNGNITIKNGTLKGGCVHLMHAKNVLIDRVKFTAVTTNHNIEICACRDVTVTNCNFEIPADGVEYVESVNIDPCVYDSFPWLPSDSVSYDGTNNYNIDIYNNMFNGGNSFLIRDGVGCHTASDNPHRHINVYNNLFINVDEEGVMLATCNYSKVYNNTIISNQYGVSISGDNNMVYDNKITSLRDSTTYVINIRENSTNFSEFNNIVISNNELTFRHMLIPENRSCTFLKLDSGVSGYVSKSLSGGVLTVTTDSRFPLTDYNKIVFGIGAVSDSTFYHENVEGYQRRKFLIDDGFILKESNLPAVITGEHEIQITTPSDLNIRYIFLYVE